MSIIEMRQNMLNSLKAELNELEANYESYQKGFVITDESMSLCYGHRSVGNGMIEVFPVEFKEAVHFETVFDAVKHTMQAAEDAKNVYAEIRSGQELMVASVGKVYNVITMSLKATIKSLEALV